MEPFDDEERIAGLNRDLAQEGDPARIRFITGGPSWFEDDDTWHIVAFWELPEPDGSLWPSDLLWRYRRRIQDLFDAREVYVESYFRTREELDDGQYHTGRRVPELA